MLKGRERGRDGDVDGERNQPKQNKKKKEVCLWLKWNSISIFQQVITETDTKTEKEKWYFFKTKNKNKLQI